MVGVPRGEFFTTDYTDYTDFLFFSREFALFAVDFGSTMRNPKEPEKRHFFIRYKGRYFRFNEIWREELLNGKTQHTTKITTNFAPVMYEVTPEYLQEHGFQVLHF